MNAVDNYILNHKDLAQKAMKEIRSIIINEAPKAIESISYAMPAYKLNGKPLIYFAAFEHHLGIYATPAGHEALSEELKNYKQGKGSVQFPLSEKMPYELIKKIVQIRVQQINNITIA